MCTSYSIHGIHFIILFASIYCSLYTVALNRPAGNVVMYVFHRCYFVPVSKPRLTGNDMYCTPIIKYVKWLIYAFIIVDCWKHIHARTRIRLSLVA